MRFFLWPLIIFLFLISTIPTNAFELSYWVRVDLNSDQNGRGYWFRPSEMSENPVPSRQDIDNALTVLTRDYHANKIYLVYHRQFEIDKAKAVFTDWKESLDALPINNKPILVPSLILREYGHRDNSNWNFTETEITEISNFFKLNINPSEIGIFDVYPMTLADRNSDSQLSTIKNITGVNLTRLGLQPDETLPQIFTQAVEDMWSGEAAGEQNSLWSQPPQDCRDTGKNILDRWLKYRASDNRKIAYLMAIVSWDYDYVRNKNNCTQLAGPGYDDANKNDVIPPGRLQLVEQTISSVYSSVGRQGFGGGGLSSDLLILEDNSRVRDQVGSRFYDTLKKGEAYHGVFSSGLNELTTIYKTYNPVVWPTSTPVISTSNIADANSDGIVSLIDFGIWKNEYNLQSGTQSDFNRDGKVSLIDFGIWKKDYVSR